MSRAEYMRNYRKKSKLQNLKDELKLTIKENIWFDPNYNFYLYPMSLSFVQRWNKENRKQFNLRYKIDGKEGDIEEAFRKYTLEKDLIHRCIKWRLFCKAIYHRKNRLPTHTEAVFNNVHKPDVTDRPDLLHLFVVQEDDPLIEVTTAEDWAEEDQFLDDIESLGISEDEFLEFLNGRSSTRRTREEFLKSLEN